MPELPDVAVYIEALQPRIVGQRLERVRLRSPFLLRTVDPPLSAVFGARVVGVRRIGKRIVLALDGERFVVLHLMIAGRLRWRPAGDQAARQARARGLRLRIRHAAPHRGELAAARRAAPGARASRRSRALDPGGLEPLDCRTSRSFRERGAARAAHAQAHAHRSAHPERDRQRVLRRDPAPGAAVAGPAHGSAHGRRDGAAARRHARDAHRLHRAHPARGRATGFPRRSPRSATTWPCTAGTDSRVPVCGTPVQRIVHAAERDQLLPDVPDGREAARRSLRCRGC